MAEINAFYDWLVTNQLSSSAINLWHALMHVANISGWPDDFTVAISRLQSFTGCGRDAIYTARNQLKQKGRIEYRERSGNQSSIYRLIPLVSVYPTQTPMQPPTQSPTQQANIIRLDYTRPDLFDDDDAAREPAREESGVEFCGKVENAFLPGLDRYFGMTGDVKREAQELAESLFGEYFGRRPTPQDVYAVFEHARFGVRRPDGTWAAGIDADRAGVLRYAFRAAQRAGVFRWEYIEGALSRCARRGLKTLDDCEDYDAQRDFDKDNGR